MRYYPLFFDVVGLPVVVVGGGTVGVRKAKGLIEAGAHVTLIAPKLSDEIPVEWKRRKYRRGDIADATFVFVATNDRKVNAAITREAKRLGIPVNVADSPDDCDFLVPARVTHGPIQIAISTGGEDPRLSKKLRLKLEEMLASVGN